MKIVHVFHHFSPCRGGIETVIERMCTQAIALGDEARVVCLNKCPNSNRKLSKKEIVNSIEVERIGFLNFKHYKVAPAVLLKLRDADIVHVHGLGFFSDFLALKKIYHRKKLVLSTHGGIFHTGRKGLLKRFYFFAWTKLVLKFFDRVVAVSQPDLELFEKIVSNKKLVLIENGVDLEKSSNVVKKRKKDSFLFVGRISENKQVGLLLDAFAVVTGKNSKTTLTIVGQDFRNLQKGLEKKAKDLGIANRVSFKGEVSDKELSKLYSESEFFVSASSYEGFGITALEAMVAGLVPVLNKIPSFERFVDEGRGITADFSQKEEAAEKMLKALGLPDGEKRGMRAKGNVFCREFSWKKKGKEFQSLYREILGKE